MLQQELNPETQQSFVSAEQINSFLRDKTAWENCISSYNGAGADPFEQWYNYICWYDCNKKFDPHNQFRQALEQCLLIYEHNDFYKQDVRMVKLWIKYIDLQENPLNLYQILYQRGVGKQCSMFYISWAHYYDSANAFNSAESVYNLGFQARALPYDELYQAHQRFRFSVSQRMLYQDNSSKMQSVNNLNEQRQQLTDLQYQSQGEVASDANQYHHQAVTQLQHNNYQHQTTQPQQQAQIYHNQHQQSQQQQQQQQPHQHHYADHQATTTTPQIQHIQQQHQHQQQLQQQQQQQQNQQHQQQLPQVQPQQHGTAADAIEITPLKLPPNFPTYCRNNYETWQPDLFLEEPFSPNVRCMYQKDQVYPGDGTEISPEELLAKRWLPYVRQKTGQLEKVQEKKKSISDDIEDQIEASTIRFNSSNANGDSVKKTIKIKFRKEKTNDSYSIQSSPSSNVNARNYHPYTTSTPKIKKVKKLKVHSSNSNSSDVANSSSTSDANLLLSFANVNNKAVVAPPTSTPVSKKAVMKYREPKVNDSFNDSLNFTGNSFNQFNDNANCSFNENNSNNIDNSNCSTMTSAVGRLNLDNSTIIENSMFAAAEDDDLKSERLDKALKIIEMHLAKQDIDPFKGELCKAFLTKLGFPSYSDRPEDCYTLVTTTIPKLYSAKFLDFGRFRYQIDKEVGKGAYGSVYKAIDLSTNTTVALKYQKPPNCWELYICLEVRKRIKESTVLPGLMEVLSAVIAPNASIIATEFSSYGSLLDINNKIRQATKKVMHESLVMHFSSQILNIVHYLHAHKIIHGDIKPDNFLLMQVPNTESLTPSLRLIDFGSAIDMTLFPEGTEFKRVIQTDGFTCTEMQEGRSWSYQTDLFCVAGTCHVMLFGEYMQLDRKNGTWEIKQKLPRYLKKHVWNEFFAKMLNIKGLKYLPNLKEMKTKFDEEAMKMDPELQNHIRTLRNLLYRR